MRLGSLLAACLLAAAPALVSAQTSAEAETAAAIARIETLNPQLNAVIAVDPEALDRNPCGSSSGSGAAVAAGMVTAAIGTETDGSITCPASINGIVGPAWSEVPLLALGYAFEQAAKIALTPGLPPSNEDAPDVAEHLRPIR